MPSSMRVARLESSGLSPLGGAREEVFSRYADLSRIIRRHLPPVTASLLAQPRVVEDGTIVEWYSDLSGRPVRLSDLDGSQQDAARRLLQDRSASIQRLADELPQVEPHSAQFAESLRQAVSYPGDDYVYVIEGQPVLAFWGHRDPNAVLTPAGTGWFRRSWPWLGGLAALFLLALLLWWLWPREEPELFVKAPPRQEEQVEEVPAVVPVVVPPPPPEPVQSVIDGPVPATRYCPEEKIIPPALVIVYDNSGSMAYPLNMPDQEVEAINNRYGQQEAAYLERARVQSGMKMLEDMFSGKTPRSRPVTNNFPGLTDWVASNYPSAIKRYGQQRVHIAKTLVDKFIAEVPAETRLGLVVYSDCDRIVRKAIGQERAGLRKFVRGLSPYGATPIAASLQQAGAMLDGTSQDNPGIIILITDGVENCEGDPCATARAIKKARPWVAAHVVKMGPESSSICVAEETGGKVYRPNSVDGLTKSINEARITAPFALGCRE